MKRRRSVEEVLAETVTKILRSQGVNVDEIWRASREANSERGRKLAEELAHTVLPLFVFNERGLPDRIGSCVLVRVDSRPYALTANHVLHDAGSAQLFAASGPNGTLSRLPYTQTSLRARVFGQKHLDIGVLALEEERLGPFARCGFLTHQELEQPDKPDRGTLQEFYYVFGYSASRTQVEVTQNPRHIHQRSFQLTTSPPEAEAYHIEGVPRDDFIMPEFDHKYTVVRGKRLSPPKLHGLSGGGVFRVDRHTLARSLAGIAIEHRKSSRYIVATRLKHFLESIRSLSEWTS